MKRLMKQNHFPFRRLIAAVVITALLAGCGGGQSSYDSATSTEAYAGAYASNDMMAKGAEQDAGSAAGALTPQDPATTDQKIIYTANLRMESTDFDGCAEGIHAAAKDTGAYFEYTDVSGDANKGTRYAHYTVRVPATEYNRFLDAVGAAGRVLSLSESASNITANYLDVQARLNALISQRDRLNTLADQAETTADLLEIESQLSDVQYEIESYTSQKRYMDSQVSYSTVEISLSEVATLTPVNANFGQQIVEAFASGVDTFIHFMQGIVIALVFMAPLLLFVAAIVLIVLVATRKRRAAKKAEKAARSAARAARAEATAKAPAAAEPAAPSGQDPAPQTGDSTPLYKQ